MKTLLFYVVIIPFFLTELICQSHLCTLPLKLGNKWNYLDVFGGVQSKFNFTVIDSGNIINNDSYYKIAMVEYPVYNPPHYIYLRFDTLDNYYKEYRHQPNLLPPDGWLKGGIYFYYKKGAQKGFSWKEELDTTYDSRFPFFYHYVKDTGTSNIFGKKVEVKYIETTDSSLYGSGEWWTKEFGIIKYNTEGLNAYLIGCVINGIAYGDTTTVNVAENIENLSNYFYLSQNYPNPFNPNTTIQYVISKRSYVTLKIYDVLGNEIYTIVNEEKSPGEYSVNFNATDLSSGIYFYKLKSGNYIAAKKMILLR